MIWSALLGGLIGAGIPGALAYLGLRRSRQSADAEAFGPAMLLLYYINPDRVAINFNSDPTVEAAKWEGLKPQLDAARGALLVVSAGNPRRRVRELAQSAEAKITAAFDAAGWVVRDMHVGKAVKDVTKEPRQAHAEAEAAMRALIDANFGWRMPWR